MEFCTANLRLQPGFRFHPTHVELVMYYLKRKVLGMRLDPGVIAEVDIYQFHPMDLRELACLKRDLNWYFFCPRWKKYGSGERTNRSTHDGYWKATGNDRPVSYKQRTVGKIKTLVYHVGKPPTGQRTDWVMHEYRLEDEKLADKGVCQDSYVLCKIFKKSGWGPKNGEQYGASFREEEWDDDDSENPNCAQMVPVDVHNQGASIMTNSAATSILVSVNACPGYTSEQGCSGAASGLAMDQAPSPMSITAANMASSSRGLIPDYNDALDKAPMPMSTADPVHVPNQGASIMTNSAATSILVSVNACPGYTSEQGCSGAASGLAMDQAPSPMSITAAANMASSSKDLIPDCNDALDKAPMPMSTADPVHVPNQGASLETNSAATSILVYCGAVSGSAGDQAPSPMSTNAANTVSSLMGLIPMSTAGHVVQASSSMPNAAGVASPSMGCVPNYDDDEMNNLLGMFTADDDPGDIFEGLEDLNYTTAQGTRADFCLDGLDLSDLNPPL